MSSSSVEKATSRMSSMGGNLRRLHGIARAHLQIDTYNFGVHKESSCVQDRNALFRILPEDRYSAAKVRYTGLFFFKAGISDHGLRTIRSMVSSYSHRRRSSIVQYKFGFHTRKVQCRIYKLLQNERSESEACCVLPNVPHLCLSCLSKRAAPVDAPVKFSLIK